MFASQVTDHVTSGPARFEVRKLSYRSLEKAQEDKVLKAAQKAAGIGPDIIRLWRENPAPQPPATPLALPSAGEGAPEKAPITEAELKRLREARYEQYDKQHVISAGVKSVTNTDTNVTLIGTELAKYLNDELDLVMSEALHRGILDLSLPPMTAELAEELTKNS